VTSPKSIQDVPYELEAQQILDNACEVWLRADDQINLLEWAIARDPTEGKALTESGNIRAITIQGAQSISSPTVTLIYRIEQHRVVVLNAKVEAAKPRQH
jgi:hypothetical protein